MFFFKVMANSPSLATKVVKGYIALSECWYDLCEATFPIPIGRICVPTSKGTS